MHGENAPLSVQAQLLIPKTPCSSVYFTQTVSTTVPKQKQVKYIFQLQVFRQIQNQQDLHISFRGRVLLTQGPNIFTWFPFLPTVCSSSACKLLADSLLSQGALQVLEDTLGQGYQTSIWGTSQNRKFMTEFLKLVYLTNCITPTTSSLDFQFTVNIL